MSRVAEYSATSEPVTGFAVRVHPHAGGAYGDDYCGGCVAEADGDGRTAVVKLLVFPGRLPRAAVEAIEDELRRLGFTRMRYERVRGGRVIPFEKEL